MLDGSFVKNRMFVSSRKVIASKSIMLVAAIIKFSVVTFI
jgi:hypothetical protein